MKKINSYLPVLMLFALLLSCADYDLLDSDDPDPVKLSITSVSDSTVSLKWTRSTAEDFRNYKVYYSRNDVVDNTDSLSDYFVSE